MTAQDLVTLPRLGGVAPSPDGQRAIYGVTTTDPQNYERSTSYKLKSLVDLSADPIHVSLPEGASSPAFGTDGWLYFLAPADRLQTAGNSGETSAVQQVWRGRLSASGVLSELALVTDAAGDVGGFILSPDASRIALLGDFARECTTFACDAPGATHLPGPGTGRLYDSNVGFVRHWDQWETPGIYGRVFTYDLVNGRTAGNGIAADGPAQSAAGAAVLIGDTPTKPFGGTEEVAFAADGSGLFFAARQADAMEPRSTNVDIYYSDLSGGAPVNLTAQNEATDTLPAPSPDGKWLAYAAMARPGYEADRLVIQLRDLQTGQTRALTGEFDRSFGSLAWTPDSRWIIATAQDTLDTPAFRIDPQSGAVEPLDLMAGNEAHIGSVMPLLGERLLFTRDSVGAPAELFLSERWGQAEPVTDVATSIVGQQASVSTRRFNFPGANGDTVWGQIHKPERVSGGTASLPVILYVHGGPQGSFNDAWSTRWNPRVLASQGYAVVSIDFHGSTGYGQAFTDSINRDWGGKPLEDLQLGLAAALALDPQIDGSRACAMGASYGGYMMNWIQGQWPERFDCLVQHDGVFDQRAMYYETEELWFIEWEHGGDAGPRAYYEDPEIYERWNPANYVQNWQTPMLVITGEQDFRIPYTQGLAAFTALQRRGIEGELLVFPDENHWVLKPKNSLQWHNTVFAWVDRWLKPE
ncbi:S9 family peptidase [Altererythrobacter sp. SALINAS58]|nr:S9 family peptidase [Alteripontixanthobacter muriae]NTZ43549.1 S9 family peptidase [Alteripontixanthobacter muriae]